ncbi:MAG: valine--tRNA ligase [Patescibacteria group bacterium]|nr:MAG: valine--tRNA ligase [Patescibacteria group bacterium]
MEPRYLHQQTEEKMYDLWEKADAFNPDAVLELRKKENNPVTNKPFSIVMPPPNANDPLHVGHAMFVSLEDVLIRYNRMLGNDTIWIPGTDHAGIETQFVFEKKLAAKDQSRFNFDRSTLFQMIWDYVQENSGVAVDQIKKLGASADWSRFKFTLDKDIVSNVLQTFETLYKDGLVYRDFKLVNYCLKCGTSYSELEVDHKDQVDPLHTIQYGPLTVATVRLETIFGDVAVAVNPNDKRYKQYIGTQIEVEFPWGTKKMPVIADEYVDPEFGTGAVKVTPYHDPNDFMMWTNHKNEISEVPQPVINTSGKLYNADQNNILIPKEYVGLGIVNARKAALEAYKTYKGGALLLNTNEKYSHSVGICYRCGRQIEPLPLPQFFISVNHEKNNLVQNALQALDSGATKIHGAGREKILRHWLNNLKDWNISRQIVWGIGIPVWYQISGYENKITVNFLDKEKKYTSALLSEALQTYSLEEIEQNLQSMNADISVPYVVSLSKPSNDQYLQETDTFDTWFSSSQWPVVTLKNAKPGDFDRFYPTSVMETGYDILPFWVMRMMLLGIYMTQKTPFSDVYLHGLVRDQKGQKMSKSKGNVINPLSVKEEYGADALRMALVIRSTPGQDKSVGLPDFKAARNLTNKVWNAARFVMLQTEKPSEGSAEKDAPQDEAFEKKLKEVVQTVTKQLNDFKIGLAADTVYTEFWHWYCDECIEASKSGHISRKALLQGMLIFLKLLHPFMPFITEAIWQEFSILNITKEKLLITANWPYEISTV